MIRICRLIDRNFLSLAFKSADAAKIDTEAPSSMMITQQPEAESQNRAIQTLIK